MKYTVWSAHDEDGWEEIAVFDTDRNNLWRVIKDNYDVVAERMNAGADIIVEQT